MQVSLKAISCNFQRITTESLKVKAESLKPKGNSISIMDLLIGKNSPVIN
jgi:hypothetical protein